MGYKTDLTDAQWDLIKHHFKGSRMKKHEKRILMNAVLYLLKTGCQWRMLPNDFPPYSTVYSFYWRACNTGLWTRIMDDLVKKIRIFANRSETPTYSIIDTQSVKTTSASKERGIDGGKKIKGRKRHIITDTMGNLLHIQVNAANIHDTKSGEAVLQGALEKYPSIEGISADAGYRKTFEEAAKKLGRKVDIAVKKKNEWTILAKRWIVERTFAWLNNSRRLSKDYEITVDSAENMITISHSATLLRRLTRL
jgi:putative transposase